MADPDKTEPRRPTPEEILARIQRDEQKEGRGRLKVFLGFAAGVGKTYNMLNEANRRKHERNQDVVIGYVETHSRKGTVEQIGDLEVIPRQKLEYRGVQVEEMDVDAIIARKPQLVVIDELAHTNVTGSKHEKRYEDVFEVMEHGINVLTTMNVQHLESLNDTVLQITGVRVRETVPDWVLSKADEIVTIDITPRALINRLERGDIYQPDKVPQALSNFFVEGNLSALREMALREVAAVVDRSVQDYRDVHDVTTPWQTQERVMVCISPDRLSDRLLRRGWRISRRLQAEIVAVYVGGGKRPTIDQQRILDADFAFARRLDIRVDQIQGTDIAGALAKYAHDHQVTQIVIGHSARKGWQAFLRGDVVNRLLAEVRGIDVLVMANQP
jgi:two-component system sensor histidine kinase KdpD